MKTAKTEQKSISAGCKQDCGRRLAGRLLMKPHHLKRPQLGLTTNQQQSWSQMQIKCCKLHTLGGDTLPSLIPDYLSSFELLVGGTPAIVANN